MAAGDLQAGQVLDTGVAASTPEHAFWGQVSTWANVIWQLNCSTCCSGGGIVGLHCGRQAQVCVISLLAAYGSADGAGMQQTPGSAQNVHAVHRGHRDLPGLGCLPWQ